METWKSLSAALPPSRAEADAARALADETAARGYVRSTPTELARMPVRAAAAYFAALEDLPPAAAALLRRSPRESVDRDACFLNVRATGVDGEPGDLLRAALQLAALRPTAVHLAPFTRYGFGVAYAVESVQSISPRVVCAAARAAGFSAEAQLRLFVRAAGLLGKKVGFDLEPHVAQFAATVLEHPGLFRWLRIEVEDPGTGRGSRLAGGASQAEQLAPAYQERLAAEVAAAVGAGLSARGLSTFESAEGEDEAAEAAKIRAREEIAADLIRGGYWTVPCQAWNCVGLPSFSGWTADPAGGPGWARFDYRDVAGADAAANAYHVATPFAFRSGLPVNAPPAPGSPPAPRADAAAFYAGIARRWIRDFGFSFVRFDSVDHVFDSAGPGGEALSDRPPPAVLAAAAAAVRAEGAWCLAERMGAEIDRYAAAGFDLVMGDDMLRPVDGPALEGAFRLRGRLERLNAVRPRRASVFWAVDTHDTGSPGLLGKSWPEIAGADGLRLRYFAARFSSCGRGLRPLYETVGLQDGSWGLYAANVSESCVRWAGDAALNAFRHDLDDEYERLREELAFGRPVRERVEEGWAWWVVLGPSRVLAFAAAWAPVPAARLDLAALEGPRDAGADGAAREGVLRDFRGPARPVRAAGGVLDLGALAPGDPGAASTLLVEFPRAD